MSTHTRAADRKPPTPAPAPTPRSSSHSCGGCGAKTHSHGECDSCRARRLQRAAEPGGAGLSSAAAPIPSLVHDVIASPGQPLDAAARAHFEPRFGQDFSHVRVHTDARAAESARAVRAQAYTVGDHIVFAPGRYGLDPTRRRLLAHELTHTVQQRGLQRRPLEGATPDSGANAQLEREADATASWIERAGHPTIGYPNIGHASTGQSTTGHPAIGQPAIGYAPAIFQHGTSPWLLRQPEDAATVAPPASDSPAAAPAPPAPELRGWEDLPADHPLRAHGFIARQPVGPSGIAAFRLAEFVLPPTKGRVLDPLWTARANAQALEATIQFTGPGAPPRTGLWQSRDKTSELRSSWLGKLGWTPDNVAANWLAAGGQATPAGAEWRPRCANQTCQMDHIVELQVGGTNSRENIQVLDPSANMASGRDIWTLVSGLAREARNSLPAPQPQFILLHFDRVTQPEAPAVLTCPPEGTPAASCMQVEQCAMTRRVAIAPGTDQAGAALENYPIRAVGASDVLRVRPGAGETDLGGDENRAPRQIVAGVLLNRFVRPAGPGADVIHASFDTTNVLGNRSPTRIPMPVLGTPPALQFTVQGDAHELRLQRPATAGVDFLYPFLSPAHLDLRFDPATGWSGRGRLRPSLPLLNRVELQLEFGEGRLRAFIEASPERLQTRIPGLRFTRAELGAQLIPEFEPSGVLAFEIGPRGRPVVIGQIDVTRDPNGLALSGPFTVQIPNVDPITGNVSYSNGELSGFVEIASENIRFPGVQSGSLRAEFNNAGVTLSGQVDLLIADTPVTLSARREGGSWVFTGSAVITVPGGAVDPVNLRVSTDGRRVWGEGRTAIRVRGLSGPVVIRYQDERWSGEATLPFSFGRATGSVTVRLNPSGRITGQGSVRYPITDRLTATVGVLLREDRTVRVQGDLVFATIPLFERLPRSGGRRELFSWAPPGIPIWGIPLGPLGTVGLTAQIRLRVGVDYFVGPGELRNLRASAALDLFADQPNFEFHGGGQIYIPFYAGFYVGIDGAIALDAAVASLSTGLGVTADAGLRGQVQVDAAIDYAAEVLAARLRFEASANPEVRLAIDAFVRATVLGADVYEQRWNLANFRWGSDLRFGLAFPVEYASNRPFELPGFENIEWIYPRDIDAAGMLRRLIT
jgi:Domain of unknown function (DUF4157)